MTFRKLLQISRPRFWIYLFGPYIVGLIAGASTPAALLDWRVLVFGLYFLLPANLLVYGVNDIFDWETDKNNPKKQGYEALVTPQDHTALLHAILITNLPFAIALVATHLLAVTAIVAFLFFSVFYSAPPIRAKTKPVFDAIFNVLYILPGFFAFFSLKDEVGSAQPFIAAWLWAIAMQAYSAIPDISADKQANTPTVATLFGFKGTLTFCLLCYGACTILAFSSLGVIAGVLGSVYLGLMLLSFSAESEAGLMRIYKWFPVINTVCGFVLFWTIALPKFLL